MEVNYKFKTEPYEHQKEAMLRSVNKTAYGLLMEMGTGKSKVLIDSVAYLSNTYQIDFAFIIAPKGVYQNWVSKEIPQHFPDDVRHSVFMWQATQKKSYKDGLKKFFSNTEPGVKIFVMNVEAFSSAKGKTAGEWIAKKFGHNGLIAIDESTTIKNHKAKRTKSLIKVGGLFKYKRILTGSPITKSPMDLFSQFQFLDPDILGHDSFFAFQGRYAVVERRTMGSHSFQEIIGYRNLEELTRKMQSSTYRVLKKDCLDLPDKVYTVRSVGMTQEQADMYSSISEEAMVQFENGELITSLQMITALLRFQQILSGHLPTDDGNLVEFKTFRLDALLDCIEEVSGKVIIWSRFRYDIINIQRALKKKYGNNSVVSYFGDTSEKDRQSAIDQIQNGTARFFVANPATAGRGLTLTEANTVIYYANDFNLETRSQSEDRCHRIGQKNPVTYIDLVAEGTVDEKIIQALRDKIDISAKVLGEEAKKWLTLTQK